MEFFRSQRPPYLFSRGFSRSFDVSRVVDWKIDLTVWLEVFVLVVRVCWVNLIFPVSNSSSVYKLLFIWSLLYFRTA